MNWKYIRLELAGTRDFPRGSASRSYLLRLPLDDDGRIDEQSLNFAPDQATVRRFWPSQPDLIGQVVRTAGGWGFSYEAAGASEERHEPVSQIEAHPIRLGGHLILTEPDGQRLPFRVARMQELQSRTSAAKGSLNEPAWRFRFVS